MAKPWADTPFKLLLIPGQPGAPTCTNPDVLATAVEMANVHNFLLRGLNAIYLQGPNVKEPQDVTDFMLYVTAWADTVHHHHHSEEELFFPRIEELAREAKVPEGVMAPNLEQHSAFESKMGETAAWAQDVKDGKKKYDSGELVRLVDGFAPVLTQHLHDEIDTILMLEKCDGKKVKAALAHAASSATKTADPKLVIPMALGCIDKTYPGGENFPPVPFFVHWLNAYWFARKHKGVWRFNPCDHWGKPRPLQFV